MADDKPEPKKPTLGVALTFAFTMAEWMEILAEKALRSNGYDPNCKTSAQGFLDQTSGTIVLTLVPVPEETPVGAIPTDIAKISEAAMRAAVTLKPMSTKDLSDADQKQFLQNLNFTGKPS